MTDKNILQKDGEHPFAKYVRVLGKGKKGSRSLTQAEAYDAMSMILSDQSLDLQLGAFLMLLRVKEETSEELAGFVDAVKDSLSPPADLNVDLDWSSYAGKRRHLPWYLFSSFLIAQAGYRVFMHGASGHTANRVYTEDTLESLGLPIAANWDDVAYNLNAHNFAYMPLSNISAKLAEIINMRDLLGLRSPVHSLSRLINPLNADTVLQGIFHPPYSGLHQEAGQILNYKSLHVLKGEGGEIERNPDNALTVKSSIDNKLIEEEWPAVFSRRHVKAKSMSIDHIKNVWRGEIEDEYGISAVVSTAAIALKALDQKLSQSEAMEKALLLWEERDKSKI